MSWAAIPSDESLSLDPAAVDEFAANLRGELVRPGDSHYNQHRKIWNGSIDRFPALIARCAGASDVITAVRFAREQRLLVAVRGGGHSFPGHSVCDGGMVIDLSKMKGIGVDPVNRTVRVQAGVLLGELEHETQSFGLVVPAGFISHTGLAGLTLGGGIGFTMRKFGLTVDNLVSADLITTDGEFVRANERENADLFWGVRGGGGNFGIVTGFEFRLQPLGPLVMAGPVLWPIEDAPSVLRFYRDWIADCPDDLTTAVIERKAPAIDGMPPELVGKPILAIICCYAGPVEEGEKLLGPLIEFRSSALSLCQPRPFVEHQRMYDTGFEPGWHYYFRSCDVAELNDDIIDVMVEHGRRIESPITSIGVWQMGGAVAARGEEETAFAGRAAGHTFNINGNSETAEGFDEEREWARGMWTALEPYHTGVYVNFLMDEGQSRVRQAYGPEKYERLRTLKRKYDPDNFFRLNQNIPPN